MILCLLHHSSMFLPSRPTLTCTTVRTMPMMKMTPPLTRYAMGRKRLFPPSQLTVLSTISFLPWKYWTGKSGRVKDQCVDKEKIKKKKNTACLTCLKRKGNEWLLQSVTLGVRLMIYVVHECVHIFKIIIFIHWENSLPQAKHPRIIP